MEKFTTSPGIYFEKIGRMHPVEAHWKLVIKTDTTSLEARLDQVTKSVKRTEDMCNALIINKNTCNGFQKIMEKGHNKIQKLINKIQTVYKTPSDKRRGLIDGLGTVAKTLFGTMDANDEKLINEQLSLLHNSNAATKHALKSQLKVINSTITHVENLEKTIEQNENTLLNLLEKIQNQGIIHNRRHDLDEHFTLVNAIINDLLQDTTETLEYFTYIQVGILHPKLTPVESIIANLREAAVTWPQGLYFPFNLQSQEWLNIEKITSISAYSDETNIYSILRFPLASLPNYEVLRVIPLPVYDHDDIFASIDSNTNWLAIDKERQYYITLTNQDLQECVKIKSEYICEPNYAISKVNLDSICEIQMYSHNRDKKCNMKYEETKNVIWIKAKNSWLYSTSKREEIIIQCKDYPEFKDTIINTGKLTLKENCKVITANTIIRSQKTVYIKSIQTYLPNLNISLLQDLAKYENDTEKVKLKKIISNPNEFGYLKMSINKIKKDLEDNQESVFQQKQFIYPMTTSGAVVLIMIIVIIYVIIKKLKNKRNLSQRATIE